MIKRILLLIMVGFSANALQADWYNPASWFTSGAEDLSELALKLKARKKRHQKEWLHQKTAHLRTANQLDHLLLLYHYMTELYETERSIALMNEKGCTVLQNQLHEHSKVCKLPENSKDKDLLIEQRDRIIALCVLNNALSAKLKLVQRALEGVDQQIADVFLVELENLVPGPNLEGLEIADSIT